MSNFLDKWNEGKFSIYKSDEKTVLKIIENINKFIGGLAEGMDQKTDLTGDHKGTWQGISRPTLSEEGMRGVVEVISEQKIPSLENSISSIVNNKIPEIEKNFLDYAQGRTINVSKNGNIKTINEAINIAKENNVSSSNRYIINVAEGEYNEKLTLVDGIDLRGQDINRTIITYNAASFRADDTLKVDCDCTIKNFTIININNSATDLQCYGIHLDGKASPYTVEIENVKIFNKGNFSHHAMGVGLYGGQALYIKNVEMQSDHKSAFYFHNQKSQGYGAYCEIDNSKFYGCMKENLDTKQPKSAILFEDVGSGKIDEVKITNSELWSYGGIEVVLKQHESFLGDRNTLYVSLKNTKYNTFSYGDGGTIIDLDNSILTNLTGNIKGNPLILDTKYKTMGRMVGAKMCDVDNSDLFIGVAVPYCGVVYAVNKGIVPVLAINTTEGAKLVTKADTSCTTGTGNVFGIALGSVGGAHAFINCSLK